MVLDACVALCVVVVYTIMEREEMNEQNMQSENGEPQTRIADNVAWHINQEIKKIKRERKEKGSVPAVKRIDAKFNDWARRNNINLNDIKLMEKRHEKKNSHK